MEKVGVRELRQNASVYLERVKKGESIEVTERGVPIAVLGPIPAEKKSLFTQLIDQGLLTPPDGDLSDWLEAHPPLEGVGGDASVTDRMIADRESERF